MKNRHINSTDGTSAIKQYLQGERDRKTVHTAVRFCLQEFSKLHPGNSVELRIPPIAAVQIIEGVRHTRGTPPAVIECNYNTLMDLFFGITDFKTALDEGIIEASGERSDLSPFLPLYKISDFI